MRFPGGFFFRSRTVKTTMLAEVTMVYKVAPRLIRSTLLAATACLLQSSFSYAATVTFDFTGTFDNSLAPFGSGSFNGSFTYDPSIPGLPSGLNGFLPSLNQFSVNFLNSSGDLLFSISKNSPLAYSAYYSPSSTSSQIFMSGVSDSGRSQLNDLSLWLDSPSSGQFPTVFVEGSALHLQRGYVIGNEFFGGNFRSLTRVNSVAVTLRQPNLPPAVPTPFLLPGLIVLWMGIRREHKS